MYGWRAYRACQKPRSLNLSWLDADSLVAHGAVCSQLMVSIFDSWHMVAPFAPAAARPLTVSLPTTDLHPTDVLCTPPRAFSLLVAGSQQDVIQLFSDVFSRPTTMSCVIDLHVAVDRTCCTRVDWNCRTGKRRTKQRATHKSYRSLNYVEKNNAKALKVTMNISRKRLSS